ncbi:MAG TPA: adenylate/guanylate cyclase domain-containing protein [Acidimicrobiales bacterium]|nr:adenylate/guanylate cyclase domain-containing protein [Acidimicrobiales bacterium]
MTGSAAITFLLTDIEGSTGLWERDAEAMTKALSRHDDIIESVVETLGGRVLKSHGEGDATFSIFDSPTQAAQAAASIQDEMEAEIWPGDCVPRVRVALHTGEADLRADDFFGPTVNRCARLRSIAHGGQSICSHATAQLVIDRLPEHLSLRGLGAHQLKDLSRPEDVFQICRIGKAEVFPPLRTGSPGHSNLPRSRTRFIGREDELQVLTTHLAQSRLVTLTGVGGSGKTRLAVEVAERRAAEFPDGRLFVDLAPVTDAAGVIVAVGSACEVGSTTGDGTQLVIQALGVRRVLLILDNCEHLLDACAEAVDILLDGCPNLTVLATSREALDVSGEQTHTVRPLGLSAGNGGTSEAAELFVDRARATRDDLELSQQAVATVEEICSRLDGIPLAIELAATQVDHLSPAQIAERLDARLTVLAGGRRRIPRQQTLAATLDWSHDLLGREEQVMLRRLAIFTGDFRPDVAVAIAGFDLSDPESILRRLVGKSLVAVDPASYLSHRLLETVRIYARERLAQAGEETLLRDRHRDHYLAWLEAMDDDEYFAGREAVFLEHLNLRTALEWSRAQDRRDLVARLAALMPAVWDVVDPADGIRWLDLALEEPDRLDAGVLMRLLVVRTFISVVVLEPDWGERGPEWLERAEALAGDQAGFWPSAVQALFCLCLSVPALLGEQVSDEIEERGRRGLELATSPGGRAFTLIWLGHGRAAAGDGPGAVAAIEQARVETQRIGSYWDTYLACILSIAYHVGGDFERAARAAVDAHKPEALALQGNALLYDRLCLPLSFAAQGAHEEAIELLVGMLRDAPSEPTAGTNTAVVNTLAAIRALQGRWEVAATLMGSVLSAFMAGSIRSPADAALHMHYTDRGREALGAQFDDYFATGQQMSLQEALAYGLRGDRT